MSAGASKLPTVRLTERDWHVPGHVVPRTIRGLRLEIDPGSLREGSL